MPSKKGSKYLNSKTSEGLFISLLKNII